MFRQTQVVADETPREFAVCFPPGTIFRVTNKHDATGRFTLLVKNDGTIKTLRYNDKTWKNPDMLKYYDGYSKEMIDITLPVWALNYTITADVKPPVGWYVGSSSLFQAHRSAPIGSVERHEASIALARNLKQLNQDWRTYVEQLQALYPFLKTIEKAPYSASVPLRMTTAEPQMNPVERPQTQAAPPQASPQAQAAPPQETITLTRDQMNYIYTMASGRALTDDVWAAAKQVASR